MYRNIYISYLSFTCRYNISTKLSGYSMQGQLSTLKDPDDV